MFNLLALVWLQRARLVFFLGLLGSVTLVWFGLFGCLFFAFVCFAVLGLLYFASLVCFACLVCSTAQREAMLESVGFT